jgi:hypothetical protein
MCTLIKGNHILKNFLLFLLAFGFLTAVHGQKTRFGQAPQKPVAGPFKVHVRASHYREDCSTNGCVEWLYVDVILNGKNLELLGSAVIGKRHLALIAPGDYQVELMNESHDQSNSIISEEYRMILPDGTYWQCRVSGISELDVR